MPGKTGIEHCYVVKGAKRLRMGYTTGTCAAGAARAAAFMLLSGREIHSVKQKTPKGIVLTLYPEDIKRGEDYVSCAVRKDAGDDPDVTDGILIYARVSFSGEPGIFIDGGEGIGRFTKPGLPGKIGQAAINPVPLEMIREGLMEEQKRFASERGLSVLISAPEGAKIAEKTFNPRLGILGGISVLGSSGIVEPMSERALTESIGTEIRAKVAQGEEILIATPGSYGEAFLREKMDLPFEKNFKCSNYVGETIDLAIEAGAKGLLFIAHIGKFVKVAAGIMNTHSHSADARMEVLCAAALLSGAELPLLKRILSCHTCDEALGLLSEAGLLEPVMERLMEKIQFYLDHRSYEEIILGAVVFSNVYGLLGVSPGAAELIKALEEGKKQGQKGP